MPIPKLPVFFDMYYTDNDGKLTSDGLFYNDHLYQSLNLTVNLLNSIISSDIINNKINNIIVANGIKFPQKTTEEINALEPSASLGTVWFNNTIEKLQVKTAPNVIETITSG